MQREFFGMIQIFIYKRGFLGEVLTHLRKFPRGIPRRCTLHKIDEIRVTNIIDRTDNVLPH